MFENLTDKLESIVSKIRKKSILSEKDVDLSLGEIRQALLSADVALPVVKKFIENIKPKAIGTEVIKSVTPDQMLIKIVHDELTNILGSENSKLNLNAVSPFSILISGLQGSGKTTTAVKLAKFLKTNHNKSALLVSLDVYRPAAQEQLKILAETNNFSTLPIVPNQLPIDIAQRALNAAKLMGSDIIIFDTAGRTQIDLQMMTELQQIKKITQPIETLLVADSLTGQVAVNIASEFNKAVDLTGIILTRIDGDGRGGAALSMKEVTGKPIKFLGTGEKIDNLELFYPARIADLILGKGDIVSLVEKAAKDLDEEKIKQAEERIKKGQFGLDDYLVQIRQMKKMGGMESILAMLPGVGKLKNKMNEANIDEAFIKHNEAIILSMTKNERDNPKIINGSRKKRIADGSGTDISAVNKLLKQFKMTAEMMKRFSSGKVPNMQDETIPEEILKQLK